MVPWKGGGGGGNLSSLIAGGLGGDRYGVGTAGYDLGDGGIVISLVPNPWMV